MFTCASSVISLFTAKKEACEKNLNVQILIWFPGVAIFLIQMVQKPVNENQR